MNGTICISKASFRTVYENIRGILVAFATLPLVWVRIFRCLVALSEESCLKPLMSWKRSAWLRKFIQCVISKDELMKTFVRRLLTPAGSEKTLPVNSGQICLIAFSWTVLGKCYANCWVAGLKPLAGPLTWSNVMVSAGMVSWTVIECYYLSDDY